MELSSTTLLATLARLGGAGLTKALSRPILRAKVSLRARRRARNNSIDVSLFAIHGWLGRRDVRDQLDDGGLASVESAVRNLAWRTAGTSMEDAVRVIGYVLDEYLRALSPQDAIAAGAARTARQVTDQSALIRSDIASVPNAINERAAIFDRDLLAFHPWRARLAQDIAKRWPAVRDLAHSLASSTSRGSALKEWLSNPPIQLTDAPAEAWLWLGELASDYGEKRVAIAYFLAGISRGTPHPDYWWARAALALDQEHDAVEMRSLLAKAGGTHPLAHAALSHLDGDYAAAETTLMNWAPDEPVDRALRATLLSAAAMGSDQIDRAIQVLEQTVQTDPDSSGVGLRAAEMILSRARFGVSLSVLRDYARARQLALAARDSRRGRGASLSSPRET